MGNRAVKETHFIAGYVVELGKSLRTRNSSGDEIPESDIALFCYPSCI